MQSNRAWWSDWSHKPPPALALLPLMVQLMSVVEPRLSNIPPPWKTVELPLTVQLVMINCATTLDSPPP